VKHDYSGDKLVHIQTSVRGFLRPGRTGGISWDGRPGPRREGRGPRGPSISTQLLISLSLRPSMVEWQWPKGRGDKWANTVIIDHGADAYTVYGHLGAVLVTPSCIESGRAPSPSALRGDTGRKERSR
jgi:hypothetical protein